MPPQAAAIILTHTVSLHTVIYDPVIDNCSEYMLSDYFTANNILVANRQGNALFSSKSLDMDIIIS